MKFDVIMGNPPYNKGIFLDFIDYGFNLSKDMMCLITPAKWYTNTNSRAASNINYKQLRGEIRDCVSSIIFYPMSDEVFDGVMQVDGLTVTLVEKKKHETCKIKNWSKRFPWFNTTEVRSIQGNDSLNNVGNQYVKSLGLYKSFKIDSYNKSFGISRYKLYINKKVSGYNFYNSDNNPRLILSNYDIVDTMSNEATNFQERALGQIFESDDINECMGLLSYLYLRPVRFGIFINLSKLTGVISNNGFRFVPEPWLGLNHIYTDEEFYEKFNTPNELVDIIAKTIRKVEVK